MSFPSTKDASPTGRPLAGVRVGISISDSPDLADLGLDPDAINVLTVDLARRVIALGGTVVLGHNWQSGGIMEAVARFALSYGGQNAAPEQPLILNYLAAPDKAAISASDEEMLGPIVKFETIEWPSLQEEIMAKLVEGTEKHQRGQSILKELMRLTLDDQALPMRGLHLTALRFVLSQMCDVRIAVGGKISNYQGLAPGIIEEAWWQLFSGKRLIACGGMGGAASLLQTSEPVEPAVGAGIEAIQNDDPRYPLAAPYLKEFRIMARDNPRFEWVEELSTEALLDALTPSPGSSAKIQ